LDQGFAGIRSTESPEPLATESLEPRSYAMETGSKAATKFAACQPFVDVSLILYRVGSSQRRILNRPTKRTRYRIGTLSDYVYRILKKLRKLRH
jgi:hypothetical protein